MNRATSLCPVVMKLDTPGEPVTSTLAKSPRAEKNGVKTWPNESTMVRRHCISVEARV